MVIALVISENASARTWWKSVGKLLDKINADAQILRKSRDVDRTEDWCSDLRRQGRC